MPHYPTCKPLLPFLLIFSFMGVLRWDFGAFVAECSSCWEVFGRVFWDYLKTQKLCKSKEAPQQPLLVLQQGSHLRRKECCRRTRREIYEPMGLKIQQLPMKGASGIGLSPPFTLANFHVEGSTQQMWNISSFPTFLECHRCIKTMATTLNRTTSTP